MLRPFLLALVVISASLGFATSADAQVTTPRKLSATPPRTATLDEYLISKLRVTTDQQKAYIKYVVKLVDKEKLKKSLVIAIQRKAVAKNPYLPFPFFERALRFEAAKRKVILPPVQQFVTTKIVPDGPRP